MAEPTAQEVLMWTLINRARLDPGGEASRYGIDLNEGLAARPLTIDSKQPLALNGSLFTVADQHSLDMLNSGRMYHNTQAVHEQNLRNAGYSFSWWGENVSQNPLSAQVDATQAIYAQHRDLFVDTYANDRGHRLNILDNNLQEVGVGQVTGTFNGTNSSLITQDFGKPAAGGQFLTGVAFKDANADAFYTVGEGRGGISIATSAGTAVTGSAGAYSQAVGAGTQTITFSGGDLAAPVSVTANITAGRNALIDLVDQSTVETSVSLTAGNGVSKIIGLGNVGLSLTGNGGNNTIVSALGNDTLDGAAGTDTAVFSGNKASYTITNNANGTVTVAGLDGTDTLSAIENLQFKDQLVSLNGGGTAGSVSINDVTISEGANGTNVATFTVSRSGGTAAFDVNFATSDGTATVADGDYAATSNTLHFGANENSKTVSVAINGDTKVEANETFNVGLSGATNGATISDAQGVGTISNDDAASVSGSVAISDVTISEGNSGTKTATFTVTRSGGTAAFNVNYATSDGSATAADGDYVASSNTLQFAANETSKTISVAINGDTKVEGNETFNVGLSGATNGATISDAQGVGTISNDDASVNHAPVVTTSNATVAANGSVAASSLFSAQDQEGNSTITRYGFWDGGNGGGHFTVNGVTQAAGQWVYVNAGDLGSVNYVGGSAAGSETLYVAARDGQAWGDYASLTATTTAAAAENQAPVATVADQSLRANEWSKVSNWVSYSDADGNAATQYQFWDGGTGANSGYFWTPDNAHHAAGTAITVNAADLGNVWVRGGQAAGTETMWVRAFDGQQWGAWDSFKLNTTAGNTAPVVTAADQSANENQWVRVGDSLQATDADGDAITQYRFWDGGTASDSGYFWTPDNAHHTAGTAITVDAANVGNVWFRGGQAAASETLWVQAFDGKEWGQWDPFKFTTTGNSAPEVSTADQALGTNQWARVTDWFEASDAEGDAITQYRFWDSGTASDSGYFWTPDNAHHAANTAITVDAADIGSVWFRGGQTGGNETVWVQAFDGGNWSEWQSLNVSTNLT